MTLDTVCLDCGEPLQVRVRDGVIEADEAEQVVGHVSLPIARWDFSLPFA